MQIMQHVYTCLVHHQQPTIQIIEIFFSRQHGKNGYNWKYWCDHIAEANGDRHENFELIGYSTNSSLLLQPVDGYQHP